MIQIDLLITICSFLIPLVAASASLLGAFSASNLRILGLLSTLALLFFFAWFVDSANPEAYTEILASTIRIDQMCAYCGILFNFVYCIVFLAFGDRVFASRASGCWILLQLMVSLALISENTPIFCLLISAALLLHLTVSQVDVYQVSTRGERFILVQFSSLLAVLLTVVFFALLLARHDVSSFTFLQTSIGLLPRSVKVLSSLVMMIMLGAFPLHFWVKPLFAAPARYGLAVITRLNIGFVVWCKLYPCIFSGDQLLETILTFGCGANLLYAALLLFGERKLTQIVSALYLFHVPLLILAVKISGKNGPHDFVLDFANITVAISGLLVILGMLRDRLGAENIDRASGLGISYPFIGIAFLVCILSLVGFPGTLGFISSEVMLHHFAEATWPVAVCFIITLALNGYSSFRIFGESFYGDPALSYRSILQPIFREKLAIALVLLFLFVSGIGPHFLQIW